MILILKFQIPLQREQLRGEPGLFRKERDKLHFYGTVKETLRIVFNRNFLPAPQIRMPAKVLITASCLNNELPVELEMVHPSVMLVAPESVCLL